MATKLSLDTDCIQAWESSVREGCGTYWHLMARCRSLNISLELLYTVGMGAGSGCFFRPYGCAIVSGFSHTLSLFVCAGTGCPVFQCLCALRGLEASCPLPTVAGVLRCEIKGHSQLCQS